MSDNGFTWGPQPFARKLKNLKGLLLSYRSMKQSRSSPEHRSGMKRKHTQQKRKDGSCQLQQKHLFHKATDRIGALHLETQTQPGKWPAPDCAPWLNSSQFLQQTQRLPVLYLLRLCESKLLTNSFSKTSHLAPLRSVLNALSPKSRSLLTTLWLTLNWKLQK